MSSLGIPGSSSSIQKSSDAIAGPTQSATFALVPIPRTFSNHRSITLLDRGAALPTELWNSIFDFAGNCAQLPRVCQAFYERFSNDAISPRHAVARGLLQALRNAAQGLALDKRALSLRIVPLPLPLAEQMEQGLHNNISRLQSIITRLLPPGQYFNEHNRFAVFQERVTALADPLNLEDEEVQQAIRELMGELQELNFLLDHPQIEERLKYSVLSFDFIFQLRDVELIPKLIEQIKRRVCHLRGEKLPDWGWHEYELFQLMTEWHWEDKNAIVEVQEYQAPFSASAHAVAARSGLVADHLSPIDYQMTLEYNYTPSTQIHNDTKRIQSNSQWTILCHAALGEIIQRCPPEEQDQAMDRLSSHPQSGFYTATGLPNERCTTFILKRFGFLIEAPQIAPAPPSKRARQEHAHASCGSAASVIFGRDRNHARIPHAWHPDNFESFYGNSFRAGQGYNHGPLYTQIPPDVRKIEIGDLLSCYDNLFRGEKADKKLRDSIIHFIQIIMDQEQVRGFDHMGFLLEDIRLIILKLHDPAIKDESKQIALQELAGRVTFMGETPLINFELLTKSVIVCLNGHLVLDPKAIFDNLRNMMIRWHAQDKREILYHAQHKTKPNPHFDAERSEIKRTLNFDSANVAENWGLDSDPLSPEECELVLKQVYTPAYQIRKDLHHFQNHKFFIERMLGVKDLSMDRLLSELLDPGIQKFRLTPAPGHRETVEGKMAILLKNLGFLR